MRREEVEAAAKRPKTQFGQMAVFALSLWSELKALGETLETYQHLLSATEERCRAAQIESLADANRIRNLLDKQARLEAALASPALAAPAPAEAEAVRVIHCKSGKHYTLIGLTRHKALGERWIDTMEYRNDAGERFTRETTNFYQSFILAPAQADAAGDAG